MPAPCPGPACYGQGGTEPTVTDANLVLGRLSPRGLLGGRMALDVEAARAALAPLAERLGFTLERTAHGLLDIVAANMVRAIRTISVERGHDPRRFTLMPFGGAGPLHARRGRLVARHAADPGAGGTRHPVRKGPRGLGPQGRLRRRSAGSRFLLQPEGTIACAGQRADAARAEAWFEHEGLPAPARHLELSLDLRYVGQNFELAVPFADRRAARCHRRPVAQSFFEAHEAAYGYCNPHDPVEVVNFRLTARGRLHRGAAPEPEPTGRPAATPIEHREVWFGPDGALLTPVFERTTLAPGQRLTGPAVIEQLDATTLIFPCDRALVDAGGNLLIELRR